VTGGLIDRRLATRASTARRSLLASAGAGSAGAALIVVQAVLLASVIDRALLHGASVPDLVPQFIGLGLTVVGRALCLWFAELVAQRTAVSVTRTLRYQLLRHSLDLGPVWLAGERAGELSLTATRGVEALGAYFGRYLPQAILAGIAPIGILVWVGVEDWVSGLVLLGMVALVPVAMIVFGREATRRAGSQWHRLSSLSARYLELIQGLPTLRAAGRAALGRREVAASTEGLRRTTMGTLRVAFLSALAMELISGLGVGLVAMLLGLRLLNGSLGLGTALAVLLVAPEVFVPLRRAGAEFHASTEGQAAAARIWEVLDQRAGGPAEGEAGGDGPRPGGRAAREAVIAGGGQGPQGRVRAAPDPSSVPIRLDEVVFSYPDRSTPVFEPVDLVVEPGEHVALAGPSGSGKSTLIAALLGFVVPTAGRILVGDVDLARIDTDGWRHRITWVPQQPHVFRGTLLENLRFGRPDAPVESIDRAVTLAGMATLVSRLPRGLDTVLGEGGLTLSAGERQRVAIARAVVRDAPLVLLDEPAAHLDAAAVDELRSGLGEWAEGRTVVTAAHRSELVRIDRVVPIGGSPGLHPAPVRRVPTGLSGGAPE